MKRLLLCLLLLLAQAQARELVSVSHNRELRGAWVASVANLNWPSRSGLTKEQQQEELLNLVTRLQAAGFNAIFFQVRPEGDALYRSTLEPWSRFLSGTQGVDPGYDPLEFLLIEAHRRNLEVHAWLNPYRARALPPGPWPPVGPHLATQHPEQVQPYGQLYWMDPSSPVVRARLVAVCRDLCRRYELDGIHFDDYFYPYPEGDRDFPDQANWEAYLARGGRLSRGDWRRRQVNQAIEEVAEAIDDEKEYLRFGISPFGIPAPEKPAGIQGLNQYEKLFADTQLWMDEGWVDYLAPQLYWPTTREPQAFAILLEWWADHAREGRYVFPGLNFNSLGTKPEWSLEEYRKQLELTRQRAHGFIGWSVAPLLEDRQGLTTQLLTSPQVLTPVLARSSAREVARPDLRPNGLELKLAHRDQVPLRAWTLYRATDNGWRLERILPASADSIELAPGRWAVAAVCMDGAESLGQVVTWP